MSDTNRLGIDKTKRIKIGDCVLLFGLLNLVSVVFGGLKYLQLLTHVLGNIGDINNDYIPGLLIVLIGGFILIFIRIRFIILLLEKYIVNPKKIIRLILFEAPIVILLIVSVQIVLLGAIVPETI